LIMTSWCSDDEFAWIRCSCVSFICATIEEVSRTLHLLRFKHDTTIILLHYPLRT
jgi:hypothetical protein